MTEERVIDGVMHRLDGKTFVPLSAEELTARLLEARRLLDEREQMDNARATKWVPSVVPAPYPKWPDRYPWESPFFWRLPIEPTCAPGSSGDVPIPGITISSVSSGDAAEVLRQMVAAGAGLKQ
jgi:hypothetical protein